jgi:hypothetical protein
MSPKLLHSLSTQLLAAADLASISPHPMCTGGKPRTVTKNIHRYQVTPYQDTSAGNGITAHFGRINKADSGLLALNINKDAVHATTHAEQNPMQITSAFNQGEAQRDDAM